MYIHIHAQLCVCMYYVHIHAGLLGGQGKEESEVNIFVGSICPGAHGQLPKAKYPLLAPHACMYIHICIQHNYVHFDILYFEKPV